MKSVLFLDVDGVLNSRDYMKNRRHITRPTGHAIDAVTVPRLNAVTDRTGAKIVISSSWRLGFELPRLADILKTHGVTGEIVGKTPRLLEEIGKLDDGSPSCRSRDRGHEIQAWLDEHPEVTAFAIVDDNSDMAHLKDRLVQTSWETGLLDEHVERLVEMLGPDAHERAKDAWAGWTDADIDAELAPWPKQGT